MKFCPKHVIESQQFDRLRLEKLFNQARAIKGLGNLKLANPPLSKQVLMSLFYEPSTRTRLSFEMAALRLGMKVLGTESAHHFSSAKKGETLQDTIRVLSGYGVDCIILRHNEDDAAEKAARFCPENVALINAGAGRNQHPTQALTDLFTISDELGRIDGVKITAGGDLSNSRVIRSLAYLASKFDGVEFTFISPKQLAVKQDLKDYLDRKGVVWRETDEIETGLPEADVVYWTRTQFERGAAGDLGSEEEVHRMELKYRLGLSQLELIGPKTIIMHPLPRNWEIDTAVDNDPRATYFRQAHNGVPVRMAILTELLRPEFSFCD